MNEQEALLILNAIPGFGNITIRKLVDYFGSAERVLAVQPDQWPRDFRLTSKMAAGFSQFPREDFLKEETEAMARSNVQALTYLEPEYPESLREIPDAPVVFYVKGKIPPDSPLRIAVVGSRKASLYGTATAERFAVLLTELGFVIVSGMARGIDTAAHKGALKAKGSTIAVLGCGLEHVYPPENKNLLEEIARGGAVISEFPMKTPPVAQNFPRRNRIISGLSLGVVVVEATDKSGALITADCALEQGREVFAVPGKIDSPSSRGTHNLIKQGAKLVMCVEDVLEELKIPLNLWIQEQGGGQTAAVDTFENNRPELSLTEQEREIYGRIGVRPVHVDEFMTDEIRSNSLAAAILLKLELRKLVKQYPGKRFARIS